MASVQHSRGKKYARLMLLEDEPKEHLESEGEKLIKDLVQQQTNTKITFEEAFSVKKDFHKGTGFIPLSALEAGTSTLTEFEYKRDCAERIQELTSRGLTYEESDRIVRGEDPIKRTNKVEVSVLEDRRREVDRLLQVRDEDDVTRKSSVSRQEKELSLATKPGSLHTRLLEFALSCKTDSKKDTRPPDHPINHLDELQKRLFSDGKQKSVVLPSTVLRKRRQQLEALNPFQGPSSHSDITHKPSSLWDVLDTPQRATVENKSAPPAKVYSCKEKRLYTVRDGKIIQLGKKDLNRLDKCEDTKKQQTCDYGKHFVAINVNSEDDDRGQRLTLEEIKQLPRFKDYEAGEPSQILYIKNLSNSVREEDLVSVFAKYEDPMKQKLIYTIMAGRMRGQAFVTFPDVDMAMLALNGTNGIVVKGKPMIVQFGRHKNTD